MPRYARSVIEISDPDVIAKSDAHHHPIVQKGDDPTEAVAGTVFALTPAELPAADAYEVSDDQRVSVRRRSGVRAWGYVKA